VKVGQKKKERCHLLATNLNRKGGTGKGKTVSPYRRLRRLKNRDEPRGKKVVVGSTPHKMPSRKRHGLQEKTKEHRSQIKSLFRGGRGEIDNHPILKSWTNDREKELKSYTSDLSQCTTNKRGKGENGKEVALPSSLLHKKADHKTSRLTINNVTGPTRNKND